MTTDDIHANLAKGLLGENPADEDGLALMILFHIYHIWLREPVLEDRPTVMELAALTQRHAADVVASVWPNRSDRQRTEYRYWYYEFNTRAPYSLVEDLPPDWMTRVQRLRDGLAHHPLVMKVAPED